MVGSRTRLLAAALLAVAAASPSAASAALDAHASSGRVSTARAALVGASEARAPLARVVVRTPQGVAAGDLLLGVVTVRAGSGYAVATPPGWRRVRTIGRRRGELAQALFVRWAGLSEPRFHTWKLRHPRGGIGAIVAYRGVDPLRPILDHAGAGARRSASVALPALDAPGALLVGFVAGTGAGRTAPPAGMRERYDAARGGRWALTAAAFDAAEIGVAGVGARRAKFNRKRNVLVAQVVGLQPASDGPVLPPTSVPPPPPPGDTEPPPPPSGLEVIGQTTQSVSLDWSGVYIDDVVGYSVYVNGTKVADRAQGATYYTVSGLACGTSYSFAVDTFDAAGNHSAPESATGSTSGCVPADTTPPSTPTGLTTTGATPTSVSLEWEAATDNIAVASYGVYRNGSKVADAVLTTHTVTGLACGTSYTFAVDAADAAGNRSGQTALTASTAACPPPDTSPPSTPTGLTTSGATQTSVSLDWDAATDNIGVVSYGVYRGETKVADAVLTANTVTGLACGTSYSFAVDAADAAGNRSAQASVTASTSDCSPPPPSDCPTLLTTPPPGYCTGNVISVTPATFGTGVFGVGGIAVAPGDVVVFEDGVYTDTTPGDGTVVQIASGGTSSQYVTFVSRNRWGAKIDGVSNTSKYGFNAVALTGNVRIEGFDIYGFGSRDVGTLAAPSASGVFLQAGGDNSQVVGNNIHAISNFCNDTIRAQTGVFIQRPGVLVESNVFHGIGRFDPGEGGCTYAPTFTKYMNSDTAVYLQSPNHSNVTVRNNLFSKLENGYGVYVYQGGPTGFKVLNNTFAGGNPYCKNAHIFTDADMNDFQVKNNVFQGPATGYAWAWDLEPLTNVVVSQNVASGSLLVSGANCSSGISPLPAGVTESGNQLNTDPGLVDPDAPLAGGFKLQSSSPAVDAGANLSALGVTVDFEGATRPQGTGFDIGAYEFGGTPPPSDTQAPSTPGNLSKTGSTTSSISVSWTGSTDNVGVTGYGLYRNGALVTSTSATTYAFTGLSCDTSYVLEVDAYDAASNHSGRATLMASTDACSPPPPPPSDCPTLMTPTPVPGYCTGRVITVTPSTFGAGVFGSGGITVSPGDVVVFAAGTYTDTNGDGAVMRISGSGTATQWVTFVSQTKWGAHMWGNNNAVAEGISLDGANYVRVEGFEVSDVGNVGSPRGSASGIDLYNGGKNSHIVGNHVHHVGRVCADPGNTNGQVGIYVQTGVNGGGIIVENNLVHDIGRFFVGENGCGNTTVSLDHGMYLNGSSGGGGGASNLTIRNNIFHDTQHGWGVQMYPGSLDNIHVLNNTFAFCNESKSYTCIVLDATITNSSIKNNVFYNPGGGKTIEAAGFAGAITIGTNLTSGNAMHDQGSTPSGMTLLGNLLSTNAQLVNPPSDFHLRITSPAIDTGETLSSVAVDHEGRARPQGSGFDIGAFEFAG